MDRPVNSATLTTNDTEDRQPTACDRLVQSLDVTTISTNEDEFDRFISATSQNILGSPRTWWC